MEFINNFASARDIHSNWCCIIRRSAGNAQRGREILVFSGVSHSHCKLRSAGVTSTQLACWVEACYPQIRRSVRILHCYPMLGMPWNIQGFFGECEWGIGVKQNHCWSTILVLKFFTTGNKVMRRNMRMIRQQKSWVRWKNRSGSGEIQLLPPAVLLVEETGQEVVDVNIYLFIYLFVPRY